MSSQLIGTFSILAAMGMLKRFGILGKIFYVRKMVLIEVQVESAFVAAVRAAEKFGGDVRSSFFLFYFLTVFLGGGETVHLNIYFVQFLQLV